MIHWVKTQPIPSTSDTHPHSGLEHAPHLRFVLKNLKNKNKQKKAKNNFMSILTSSMPQNYVRNLYSMLKRPKMDQFLS